MVIAAEALVIAAGLLALGYLLIDAIPGTRRVDPWFRVGLAPAGLMGYALCLMLLHVATGGDVFDNRALVRGLTVFVVGVLAALKLRRRSSKAAPRALAGEIVAVAILTIVGLLLWGSPVVRMLPVGHIGDQNLHMGWAGQLMNGEPMPSTALSGDVPNYYPWLFHALVALMAHCTAGGRAFHAQAALLLLQVTGAGIALFALGRQLTGRWTTGAAAWLFGALSGGLGFLLLRGPDLVVDPRAEGGAAALRYLGDLLYRRSYNLSFHNLAPVFPRDVAYVLTFDFLLVLVVGLQRRSSATMVGAGLILGLIGLTGGETFIVGAGLALVLSFLPGQPRRARLALAVLGPAVALWSLWSVPLAINYVRLGGFVNTASAPVVLPPTGIVGSWGVGVAFAVVGVAPALRTWRRPAFRVLVSAAAAAATALLLSALLPDVLGAGFTTLGRQHRYWPLLHLPVLLCAAVGASFLFDLTVRRRPALAIVLIVGVSIVALPSPLAASLALPEELTPDAALRASLLGEPRTPLNLIASPPGRRCTVAVPSGMSLETFAYTGYRFVSLLGLESPTGPRIRWRRIFERIPTPTERFADNALLTSASGGRARWESVGEKYGTDKVMLPASRADSPAPRGHARATAEPRFGRYTVVELSSCDD